MVTPVILTKIVSLAPVCMTPALCALRLWAPCVMVPTAYKTLIVHPRPAMTSCASPVIRVLDSCVMALPVLETRTALQGHVLIILAFSAQRGLATTAMDTDVMLTQTVHLIRVWEVSAGHAQFIRTMGAMGRSV